MKNKILLLLGGLIIFLAGSFLGYELFQRGLAKKYDSYPNLEAAYQLRAGENPNELINPLLSCEIPNQAVFAKLQPLRQQLQKLIADEIKNQDAEKISVYYRDLISGQWLGVNEDEPYIPASLVKVPLLLAYYKYAETRPEILDKQLLFDSAGDTNLQQEVAKPPDSLETGKQYPISYLIYRMIAYSGNNSYSLLVQAMDKNFLQTIYGDLKVNFPEIYGNGTETSLSAKSFATFFRILYNATYLNHTMSEKALELLAKTNFTKGLVAGVPGDVTVAHKFGERTVHLNSTGEVLYRELHDCGIVYDQKRPYTICVMTHGHNFNNLEKVISAISKTAYDAVQGF
jgi:beta-lactamase class A